MRPRCALALVWLAGCFDPASPASSDGGENLPPDAPQADSGSVDGRPRADAARGDAMPLLCPIVRTVIARDSDELYEVRECEEGAQQGRIDDDLPGRVEWAVIQTHPQNADEALVAAMLSESEETPTLVLVARMSDGWSRVASLSLDGAEVVTRSFDIAYEQKSGESIAVLGDGSKIQYWQAASGEQDALALASDERVLWLELAADPASDQVLAGFVTTGGTCAGLTFHAMVWDGSSWHGQQVERIEKCSAALENRRPFDVAWIGGRPWAFYTNATGGVNAQPLMPKEEPALALSGGLVGFVDVAASASRVAIIGVDVTGGAQAVTGTGLGGTATDISDCQVDQRALFPAVAAFTGEGDAFVACKVDGERRVRHALFDAGEWVSGTSVIPAGESLSINLSFQAGPVGDGAFLSMFDAADGKVFFALTTDVAPLFHFRKPRVGQSGTIDGTVSAFSAAVAE